MGALIQSARKKRSSKRVPGNLPDLHVHTHYCGHAEGTMEESVQVAIRLGLAEVGFAGHFPYPQGFVEPVPDCVIPEDLFPQFVDDVFRLRKIYENRIHITLGAEVDYLDGFMEKTKALCRMYPLDYVIGSVHMVEGVPIDYSHQVLIQYLDKMGGVGGMCTKYWKCVEKMIRSGICDVVAHLDLPKKVMASRPSFDDTKHVEFLLDLIFDRNIVLEVNTGGIDRSFDGESYPSQSILRMAAERGIEITLGSDAHRPEEVGRYFRKTAEFLRTLGWTRVVVFEAGEKRYQSL
jgi:histidinol-phosphatase (PHP family)